MPSALTYLTQPSRLSRRRFLELCGAAAGTALLGACAADAEPGASVEVPIGSFTAAQVGAPCGLAGAGVIIGAADDPASFTDARRGSAQILWFSSGYVEYTLPPVPDVRALTGLEISAEVCSETTLHNDVYPSDITLWLGGTEIVTFTSPGDLGDRPGRYTPTAWWDPRFTQYGELKTWRVDRQGTFLDGVQVSGLTLADLNLAGGVTLRLGVAEGAVNAGGMNLFGAGFGDYGQGIEVTYQRAV